MKFKLTIQDAHPEGAEYTDKNDAHVGGVQVLFGQAGAVGHAEVDQEETGDGRPSMRVSDNLIKSTPYNLNYSDIY